MITETEIYTNISSHNQGLNLVEFSTLTLATSLFSVLNMLNIFWLLRISFGQAAISFSPFFLSHPSRYIRIEQGTLHLTGRCIFLFHNSSSAANVSQIYFRRHRGGTDDKRLFGCTALEPPWRWQRAGGGPYRSIKSIVEVEAATGGKSATALCLKWNPNCVVILTRKKGGKNDWQCIQGDRVGG